MIWLDAHLSPRLASWITESLGVDAKALREIGLRDAEDQDIFDQARKNEVIILTKDKDFADLVVRCGPPPAVIWLRCGNTSEERLKQVLSNHLTRALDYITTGEPLVEIQ
jgi:predicted nuclease of predicted toxin-antitoxin system